MLCNNWIRCMILRTGIFSASNVQFSNRGRSLQVGRQFHLALSTGGCEFSSRSNMMVDFGSTAKGNPSVDVVPEENNNNGNDSNGGYASGGWKSEDGKLSCGYSSFRGKRVSMEDFYDIKSTNIEGKAVCMFGIFDGWMFISFVVFASS